MTTATMGRRIGLPAPLRPSWRAAGLGFSATLCLALVATAIASVAVAALSQGAVLPRVSVGGVDVAGLSRSEAAGQLESVLPSLSSGKAAVVVGDDRVSLSYADLGRGYELDAMTADAYAIGRSGNPFIDTVDRLRALLVGANVPLQVRPFDPEAADRAVARAANELSYAPVEAAVRRDGATFTVTPSAAGRGIAASELHAALGAELASINPDDVTLRLTPQVTEPELTTAEAEAAATAASAMAAATDLTIPGAAEGDEPIALAPETIAGWISFETDAAGAYEPVIDSAGVTAAVTEIKASIDRDPVEASISVAAGSGLGGVVPGQDGRVLDVEASTADLLTALERRAGGVKVPAVALAVNVAEPSFTTAEAQALLPQMQMVSSWTTYYVPGDGNGFGANINIGAWDIDGRNLYPGEWFSFWDSIGPVTVERGYRYGGAIINGRSTQGVAIGGGICSTSTTIFNAALRAGLEMGIRANHHYYIDRYPDGLDATVSIIDDWTQDMTFRNDTEHPIVIRGFGGNGFVTFEIWSAPMGRSVVITDPITSNHRKAIETTQVVASMAPGTSKRVEYPHDGHDVSRSRIVYDANGNQIHRNDYFSHYATVNGLTLVGPSS
jgi:vancomycin resistance protein YoaR